mgnify:FL=1
MKSEEWLSTELGQKIWKSKYCHDEESLDEWFERVSGGDQNVKKLIMEHKFLFGGRTLSNRGLNDGSYSNCYSSGYVADDLSEIMRINTNLAMTYKAQGGQGVSLSKIRPKGSLIKGRYTSDGIVPIMEMYNKTTESISQGGSRKGALMISIDITHPEAATFITIKSDPTKINKANLSVEVSDEFMSIVEDSYLEGKDFPMHIVQQYGNGEITEYDIFPIRLYKLLMQRAWGSAEPGVIFTTPFRNHNLMEFVDEYQIETCNPCGEQPLPKDGACNLGSMNLSEYVVNPFSTEAYFDKETFARDVYICIEALDNIIDENLDNHALPEQREMSYKYRNIGLGVMGLADALIKLGITYGSYESIVAVDKIMKLMFKNSILASSNLAAEKGTYPSYNDKMFNSSIMQNILDTNLFDLCRMFGMRNCSLLSIAPTGSLGTMLNVSTGIEPNFALEYNRKTEALDGHEQIYKVYCGIADQYTTNFKVEDKLPDYFVTSHDLDWKDRINVQAVAQQYVDTAISSTINLDKDITVEEVEKLYLYAWQQGLKGITIFRDGCRDAILSLGETKQEDFFTRPDALDARVVHFINEGQQWVAFIGTKNGKPFEIFSGPADMELFPIPKSVKEGQIIKVKTNDITRYDFRYKDSYGYTNTLGGLSRIFNQEYWNYARLVSGMMRHQMDTISIIEIIDSMHSESETLNTWKNGVIRSLKTFIEDGTTTSEKCLEDGCDGDIIYINGCKQCAKCGWSKCS